MNKWGEEADIVALRDRIKFENNRAQKMSRIRKSIVDVEKCMREEEDGVDQIRQKLIEIYKFHREVVLADEDRRPGKVFEGLLNLFKEVLCCGFNYYENEMLRIRRSTDHPTSLLPRNLTTC